VGADIDGEAAYDNSGNSVSISSDGTRVAIGAIRNDGNGSEAGHVRVFDWSMITGSKKILKENIVEVGGELIVSGNATVSSSLTVSGNVTADHFVGDGSNITGISSTLQAITDSGPGANVTSNTVQFSNAITGFVTTSNVEVGGELTVTGNVVVDTNTLFVDSVNNRVGIGTTTPDNKLDVDGNVFLSSGNSIRLGTTITNDNNAGIAWNDVHDSYFIKRGAGSWSSPDYTQLYMYWPTGIVLNPGNETYGKSRVTVIGNTRCQNSYSAPTGYTQMNQNGSVFRNYTSGGNTYGAGLHFTAGAVIPADLNGGGHQTIATQLGHTYYRWGQIYSTSSSISTSDRNKKQDINEITESERKVASKIVDLFRTFRMKDAVSKKGDEARLHNGVIAQDLIEVFQSEGLNAHRYGLFCYDDIWLVDGENELYETVYEKDDSEDDGVKEVKVKTGVFADKDTPGAVATPGPYSIRYEELLCFVVAGELQNERIKYSTLEARVAALENV
jgi:hypothetical protein